MKKPRREQDQPSAPERGRLPQDALSPSELKALVSHETGLPRKDVARVYAAFLQAIGKAEHAGRKVELPGLEQMLKAVRVAGSRYVDFCILTEGDAPRKYVAIQIGSSRHPREEIASEPIVGILGKPVPYDPKSFRADYSRWQDFDNPFKELAARLLSQWTRRDEGHLVFNGAEIEQRFANAMFDVDLENESHAKAVRALRNEFVHMAVTTNYDRFVESVIDGSRRVSINAMFKKVMGTTLESFSSKEESDNTLDIATAALNGFIRRLVNDLNALDKVTHSEAVSMGSDAAEHMLAIARWSRVVGDRLDTASVTRLLGITRQALAKRQESGSVLALPGKGTKWYPTWQFDMGQGEIRPEVRQVIGAFRDRLDKVNTLLIASWATTEQIEDLDGLTPAQWIVEGRDPDRLRIAAERAATRIAQ